MVVMLMASCTRGDAVRNEDDANSVTEISVVTEPLLTVGSVTRAGNEEGATEGATDGEGGNGSGTTDDIEDMTVDNKFDDGKSLLYISQMGTTKNPNFDENTTDEDKNLYIYTYYENRAANWDTDFNFKAIRKEGPLHSPIEWPDIKTRGSVGNAFSLYALHFPVENKVRFNVEKNQKSLENFRKSDIMGAYHATSSLYSRLRFRLYHLMHYLRVTLYVPVYQEPEGNNQSTGFDARAVKNAFLKDVNADFDIEWRAPRSSDNEAPLVQAGKNPKTNVFMYEHPSNNDEIKTINVKEFYGQGNLNEDNVYEYNFSVLIPTQTIGSKDQFMQFQLLPAGSGTDDNDSGFDKNNTKLKTYYFQTDQLIHGSTGFQLTQGSLSHLTLYLPRTGNDVILVSAKIVDWTNASTDMTVTKQPENGGDEEEDDEEKDDNNGGSNN